MQHIKCTSGNLSKILFYFVKYVVLWYYLSPNHAWIHFFLRKPDIVCNKKNIIIIKPSYLCCSPILVCPPDTAVCLPAPQGSLFRAASRSARQLRCRQSSPHWSTDDAPAAESLWALYTHIHTQKERGGGAIGRSKQHKVWVCDINQIPKQDDRFAKNKRNVCANVFKIWDEK